jgi:hypothetical protein
MWVSFWHILRVQNVKTDQEVKAAAEEDGGVVEYKYLNAPACLFCY